MKVSFFTYLLQFMKKSMTFITSTNNYSIGNFKTKSIVFQ
jgi:hypothetical protein